MAVDVVYPVAVLRETTEALGAARALCAKEPDPKAVHRLRTLSRRVEAQMLLLASMPARPKHKKETKRLHKELRQLRRGAGEVRDLDVQRKRLTDFVGPESDPVVSRLESNQSKEGSGAQEQSGAQSPLLEGLAVLDAHLAKQRAKRAAELQVRLHKHGSRLTKATYKLLERLGDAHRFPLSAEELLAGGGALVARDALLGKNLRRTLTEEELHRVRKGAKAARYLAEMMPGNPAAEKAAKRFEALQDAGGTWHDDLELARQAKAVLGKKHALTTRLLSEQGRHLRVYREALRGEAKRLRPLAMPTGVAAA